MADHHDSIALDWVRGEIQETLKQGQHALEAYVENRDDTARLRFCLNYLHQVHGTLQMVELFGAALLTEEMEKVAQAMLNETVVNTDDAISVLMQAMLQLPQYLEQLQSSRDDVPLVLLPLLNDLRASRAEPLLSETALFTPDLSAARFPAGNSAGQHLQDAKVLSHVEKLRQMFQFAAAGLGREQDLDVHFEYLEKVINRLIKICQHTPMGEIWLASGALVESLKARINPVNSAIKALINELDLQIKRLIDEHVDVLQQPVPEALLKNILFYVARAQTLESPRVQSLVERYRLAQALPDEQSIDAVRKRVSGPNREAIHSVVSALNEELARIKDQLDLFVRAKFRQNSDLEELIPGLQQIANTLAVLGLAIPRKVIADQVDLVSALATSNDAADDGVLMDIAGSLLYVEATLTGLDEQPDRQGQSLNPSHNPSETGEATGSSLSRQHLSDASTALLREARNSLEQVKSAIVSFIASQWDVREVAAVPELLHSIQGGLQLIPLQRAAKMLASCETFVRQALIEGEYVPDWQQLDTLADAITSLEYYLERMAEGVDDNDNVLALTEESLVQLGFPSDAEPTWQRPSEQSPSEPTTTPEPETLKTRDNDLVDDEILEIFVEEATEVLESIRHYHPPFRRDPGDHKALGELRRSFHTLKGSGRLVGADAIGELGWAVENLLNRVLERSVQPGDAIHQLLDQVIERLPSLVEDFRQGQPDSDVESLIAQAEALASARPEAGDVTPAETAVAAAPVPTPSCDDDDFIDDEILEIFIEEAHEVQDTINEFLPRFLAEWDNPAALTELRRAFHTLKGSGRMVGASAIGELSWSVENLLNRLIEGAIFMNEDVGRLLNQVVSVLPAMVSDFQQRQPSSQNVSLLIAQADALSRGELLDKTAMPAAEATAPADDAEQPTSEQAETAPRRDAESNLEDVDPVLLDIFRSETETHLEALREFLTEARQLNTSARYSDTLSRALHTLKGSANTANITPIARVVGPVEKYVKTARAENLRTDEQVVNLLQRLHDFVAEGLAQLELAPQLELVGTGQFLADLNRLAARTLQQPEDDQGGAISRPDPQLVKLFLNEGMDVLLDADRTLDHWAQTQRPDERAQRLEPELQELAEGAAAAGLADIHELADVLHQLHYRTRESRQPADAGFFSEARSGHDHLIDMMDQVAAGLATRPDNALVARLREQIQTVNLGMERAAQAEAKATVEAQKRSAEFSEDLDLIDRSLDETLDFDASWEESLSPGLPVVEEGLDTELEEIFLEEASDLIDHTGELLQQWTRQPEQLDLLRQLQRDLHTLKGGARMADIGAIGDLGHELETLFEGLTEGRIVQADDLEDLLLRSHDRLAAMVDGIKSDGTARPAPDLIGEIQHYMTSRMASKPRSGTVTGVHDNLAATSPEPLPQAATAAATVGSPELDPELADIFLEEAHDLINSTASSLYSWVEDPADQVQAKELQRNVHTLKGGARMAQVAPIGDLSHALEDLFDAVVDGDITFSTAMGELLFTCHDALARMVEQLAAGKPLEDASPLIAQVEALTSNQSASDEPALVEESADADLSDLFLEEAREIENAIADCLDRWEEGQDLLSPATDLQSELQSLKDGARLADINAIAELAGAWDERLQAMLAAQVEAAPTLALSQRCLACLGAMLDSLEDGQQPQSASQQLAELNSPALNAEPKTALNAAPALPAASDAGPENAEDVDTDVLEIFLEEAVELVAAMDQILADWSKDPANPRFNNDTQRILHTLKGGARLANITELGNQSHDFEAHLITLQAAGGAPTDADWSAINRFHDQISSLVEKIQTHYPISDAGDSPAAESAAAPQPTTAVDLPPPVPAQTAQQKEERRQVARARRKADAARAAQETIRVNAQLVDELVNLAGETSITRGRMEQQVNDFSHTLDDMVATIDRLREQLRRMDIETETQILFSAEKEFGSHYDEEFDPLEMDRYSSIQQLSRALAESASDLADLRETLSDKARDAETLLLQQSRINTELQEGLMKTRMIPFASMVPRLRRIVRQISGELGKKVEFDVRNAEGELDRTVLERMIAPLEHMLRNALDHGIETVADRLKAGKPETGQVELSLSREGGEVVLRMVDDGAGIRTDKVREKAIRNGLLHPSEEISDRDILQFILQPGFSTAQAVTQISGRGVGMDVVGSEVKQLGGSLDIDSVVGQGTTFTVRLPFTVSVNRALMVSTGEDFYAIPLNTIEGIVRVSTYELEEYYKPESPLYEYAGQSYRLQYLGALLHSDHQPKLQGQALPLPVILVRGADQPMALQVDSLMGSREIVVKSLGPQFGSVRGVSGATILGDGNVVVILDLPAMIRADILSSRQRQLADLSSADQRQDQEQATRVMVVDDSVTVRKVTSRLLERHGMDVLLAKDGLDAVAQLQEQMPDVILLDIEMPRMDGFEVASFIRHDSRLRHIPIIMITSRTGSKHRERAMALGVNEYLGKPFQEKELLETIERLSE